MPAVDTELEVLARTLRQVPGLSEAVTRDRKRYSNLSYCILAAIFSINAQYRVVLATVHRYRAFYDLPPLIAEDVLPGRPEPTVSDLIAHIETVGVDDFALKESP